MAKLSPDSIYCKLIKLTRQKEDFFTESLAFALQKDAVFLRNFMQFIAGNKFSDFSDSQFDVKTQVAVPFGRLDMVITVNGSVNVVIENKLWSKEGEGQLKKYIKNDEINFLAFITAEDGYKIDPSVLNSDKYLKPSQSNHFTWETLLPVVDDLFSATAVPFYLAELRHLFLYLGFGVNKPVKQPKAIMPVPTMNQQVSPAEVAVYDRKSSENIFTLQTNVQERFQRLYKENIVALENLLDRNRWGSLDKKQYKEIGNKHGQIYAYNMDFSNESRLLRLYITPTKEGNAVRIRFTINDKSDFMAFVDAFEANLEKDDLLFELIPDVKKCEQIEVAIPIPDLPCNDSEAFEYLLNLYEIVMKSVKDASHL